jgi:hypothetical protein
MKKIIIKLPDKKAKLFSAHLKKEHPKYSRRMKVR